MKHTNNCFRDKPAIGKKRRRAHLQRPFSPFLCFPARADLWGTDCHSPGLSKGVGRLPWPEGWIYRGQKVCREIPASLGQMKLSPPSILEPLILEWPLWASKQRTHCVAFPTCLTTKSRVPRLTRTPQDLLWNSGPFRVILQKADTAELLDLT